MQNTPPNAARISEVLNDPSNSFWLKKALADLMTRDPVDAAADAEALNSLMQERVDLMLR